MSDEVSSASVKILDRYFSIKCPPEEVDKLQEAALFLEKEMYQYKDGGRTVPLETLAVLTALNLCHKLLEMQRQQKSYVSFMDDQVKGLHTKIDEALAETN